MTNFLMTTSKPPDSAKRLLDGKFNNTSREAGAGGVSPGKQALQ